MSPKQWCMTCSIENRGAHRATYLTADGDPLCTACWRALDDGERESAEAIAAPSGDATVETRKQQSVTESPRDIPGAGELAATACRGTKPDGEACNRPIGAHSTSGLCSRCYARAHYRRKHPAKAGTAKLQGQTSGQKIPVVHVRAAQAKTTLASAADIVRCEEITIPESTIDQWFTSLGKGAKADIFARAIGAAAGK